MGGGGFLSRRTLLLRRLSLRWADSYYRVDLSVGTPAQRIFPVRSDVFFFRKYAWSSPLEAEQAWSKCPHLRHISATPARIETATLHSLADAISSIVCYILLF